MSKAYKCDRCGKLYTDEQIWKPAFSDMMLIKCHHINDKWESYDLCDECDEKLKEWFTNVQSETN